MLRVSAVRVGAGADWLAADAGVILAQAVVGFAQDALDLRINGVSLGSARRNFI